MPVDATRLTRLARVQEVRPSPDGRGVAVAVQRLDAAGTRYVGDLWWVPLDRPSEPTRLTRGDVRDGSPRFRRDGSLGFLSNRDPDGGPPASADDARTRLWLLPAEGGEPLLLVDEPLGVEDFAFAAGGDRLVVQSPLRPGIPYEEQRTRDEDRRRHGPGALRYDRMPVRAWDRWIGEPATQLVAFDERGEGRRNLTPEADRERRDVDWVLAPDGSTLVAGRARPADDRIRDIVLEAVDLDGGGARTLLDEPRTQFVAPRVSPDGRRLASLRVRREPGRYPRQTLSVLALDEDAPLQPLARGWDRLPTPETWTSDGRALLVTAVDQGRQPVFRIDLDDDRPTRVSAASAGGSHGGLHRIPGTEAVVGVRSRWTHPPEPFRIAVEADAEPEVLARLSGFEPAEAEALATLDESWTSAEDDAPLHTLVVAPRGNAGESPHPLLLWIHGGPVGEWTDGWHWRWNPLIAAARGYAVALPNPRGSPGYGRDFVEGVWNNAWGGACYRDLERMLDAVCVRDDVDGERVAAMGGSFGGFMANWMGTRTGRFRCLISHAGIFHLASFFGATDHPEWLRYQLTTDPYDDPERFLRYSPHRGVHGWQTPTLFLHGARDFRVPIGEALAAFEALQARDVPSELVVFPDENHWIQHPRNIVAWHDAVYEFLDRHLGSDDGGDDGDA